MAETIYLKAMTVRDHTDIDMIKKDIKMGMILIVRVGPMAQRDLEGLRKLGRRIIRGRPNRGRRHRQAGRGAHTGHPAAVQIWKPQYDLK